MFSRIVCAALLAGALAAAAPARAGCVGTTRPQWYALTDTSDYEMGCYGPCMCAILIRSHMSGLFRLAYLGSDGQFQHFLVDHLDWTLADGGHVTGSGTYLLGGDFALEQQMTLDLSIEGAPPLRFDSGLHPGGGTIPFHIRVSRHQEFCHDTVFVVDANPIVLDPTAVPAVPSIARVVPNPSSATTVLEFSLPADGPARFVVTDLAGRVVRTLVPGTWLGAGAHLASWDGLDDRGRRVAAGVYLTRLVAGGRVTTRTLVRLR